ERTFSVSRCGQIHSLLDLLGDLRNSVVLGSLLVLISMTLTYPSPHMPARSPTFFKTSSSSSSRLARGNGHQAIRRRSPQLVHRASRNCGLNSISSVFVSESSLLAL